MDIQHVEDKFCECKNCLKDKWTFGYFINNKWDYSENRDPYVCYHEYTERLTKLENATKYKGYTFITLSPDHNTRKIEYNPVNIAKLIQFCRAQFTTEKYSYFAWIVESGKHINDPHLHVHAFVKIIDSKNHKRDLLTMWNKFFPPLIGDDYHIVKCNTKEMFVDKQNYLKNDRKGTHMNFEDLSLPPYYGFDAFEGE